MTTDEFNTKYKLLKQIAQGNGRSFTAMQCGTERAVLVHFMSEDTHPTDATVLALVDRLGPRDRSKILEILTVNLSTVVVTQFLENLESFEVWLRGRLSEPPAAGLAPSARPSPLPGEFTKMFEPPEASSPPPAPSVAPPKASPVEQPRGSFTEMFRTPPEPKASPLPPPAPMVTPAVPPLGLLSVRLPPSEPAPRRADPMPSWPDPFQQPQAPKLPPLPTPMLRPRGSEPIVKPPSGDPLPPPAPLPAWSGPSDYTRQLRSVAAPTDPAAPIAVPAAPAAPATPAGEKHSIVPLLLILNIVVIIATGLVVYFALKRH